MPLRRTPPPAPASPAPLPLTHCKSDSNLSGSPTIATIAVPTMRVHATSEPNITVRKRAKDGDINKCEILDLFSTLQKEQEKKFTALMNKVQLGINSHTEQNKEITSSIEFLGKKYDEMMARISSLEQNKIADQKYIKSLEVRLDQMERRLQTSSFEVRNVPKKTGETKEDLLNLVTKVGTALSVPVKSADIRDVYRINTKNENNQPIVAELTTVIQRDKIIGSAKAYNKKYSTCKFSTSNLKLDGPTKPIFISESLTVRAKKLFYLAREFAKSNNLRYCWASRGNIYMRRTDGAPLIKINNESDLENFPRI